MNSPLLGLDVGLKRTGVALSESGIIVQPLLVLEAKPPHLTNVVREVVKLVQEYEIKTLVVGMPNTSDDGTTAQALKVESIISQLEDALGRLPKPPLLEKVNEFGSSIDARELYPNDPIDSASAAIILQTYIDTQV